MRRRFCMSLAVGLLLGLALPALASMAYLTVNTISFADRTFEYGGHVSYTISEGPPPGGFWDLTYITHNNNCGSGQCGNDPVYLAKCRITSGDTTYHHSGIAKTLLNGEALSGTELIDWDHETSNWIYFTSGTSPQGGVGSSTAVWKWRVTIRDSSGTSEDSNDVTL